MEKSESIESALIRELKEELNIEIRETEFLMELKHDYDAFRVKIHFYLVRSWSGLAIGNESQLIQWYSIDQLSDVDLLAADTPVIKVLKKVL